MTVFSNEQVEDFRARGFSRRSFARLASLLAAGATVPFYTEPILAQLSATPGGIPAGAVKIDANENPMGPCPNAAEAIHNIVQKGGRYMFEQSSVLANTLAECEGLKRDHVTSYAGSSTPLHHAVIAFTGPSKSFVTGEPGYEAGEVAAKFIGAPVVRVPLTKTYAHDVRAMAAVQNAGLIYVCNPNNPSGTLTPRADIEWLIANKPARAVVMVDEAYIHFCGAPTVTDLVGAGKDLIVLRTFSKLYGMAGLRAGAAIARPDLLAKVRPWSAGGLPITAMVGATASLKDPNVVPERRKKMQEVREDTLAFLDKRNIKYVPSVSNKFMMDVGRPGEEFRAAMRAQNVYVGRIWPCWPNYVRVTVGSADDMAKFKAAVANVMG